jgi:DinB superfamily
MASTTTNEERLLSGALNSWKTNIERADKLFSALTPEQLQKEIAPGKNRLIYLWGHLTAVHDAMLPLLGFGPRLHPELDVPFISKPDKGALDLPSAEEVKKSWNEANGKLREGFAKLSAADWLQKHAAVSDEDFAKDPLRNRFAILLSRTNHLAYHLGQAALAPNNR